MSPYGNQFIELAPKLSGMLITSYEIIPTPPPEKKNTFGHKSCFATKWLFSCHLASGFMSIIIYFGSAKSHSYYCYSIPRYFARIM